MQFAFLAAELPNGEALMKKNSERVKPKSMKSTMVMFLRDADASKPKQEPRKIMMVGRTQPGGEESYIEFLSPADVSGTKFLTTVNDQKEEFQRIWLPALGKVRLIASSGKEGNFMGSDLSYYDMENHDVNDSTYVTLKEDVTTVTVEGTKVETPCWVIESKSKSTGTPYSKSLLWLSKADNYIYKTELYNRKKGTLEKTVYITEVKKIGNYIIPTKTLVVAANGHKTLLNISDIEVDIAIDSSFFSVQQLQK